MVKMINKRATMLANPFRFLGSWNESLQDDFDSILLYFNNSGTQSRKRFKQDARPGESTPASQASQASQAWLRINRA